MSDNQMECPFCGTTSKESVFDSRVAGDSKEEKFSFNDQYIICATLQCAHKACKKQSLWILYYDEKNERALQNIVPKLNLNHLPEKIRKAYGTACQNLDIDPNASAAMVRRCLHLMIKDFHKIKETNLNKAINIPLSRIEPPEILDALHKLRKLGNLGLHGNPSPDFNDVTRDEAEQMIELLELLFRRWYIAREEDKDTLAAVSALTTPKTDAPSS